MPSRPARRCRHGAASVDRPRRARCTCAVGRRRRSGCAEVTDDATPMLARAWRESRWCPNAQSLASMPTRTNPNHATLMTGVEPEAHGITGNAFWDREKRARAQARHRRRPPGGDHLHRRASRRPGTANGGGGRQTEARHDVLGRRYPAAVAGRVVGRPRRVGLVEGRRHGVRLRRHDARRRAWPSSSTPAPISSSSISRMSTA